MIEMNTLLAFISHIKESTVGVVYKSTKERYRNMSRLTNHKSYCDDYGRWCQSRENALTAILVIVTIATICRYKCEYIAYQVIGTSKASYEASCSSRDNQTVQEIQTKRKRLLLRRFGGRKISK